ncbi:MAG: hypothetical protein WBD58_19695 [Geitlerinemataceae cyanobacterium]
MTNHKGKTMIMTIVDRIGNWNPQLFREWKGRLTGRNLASATVLSLLGQLIIGMVLQSKFPIPKPSNADADWVTHSPYCTGESRSPYSFQCLPDGLGSWQLDWKDFWLDMATWSSVAILVALVLGGVYLLIDDLAKEQKRGTLNFIRLSPQSSESILIGKILGVPVLVYFAVALVLPMHIVSVIAAGLPIDTLFRFYLLAAAGCGVFYNVALLFAFLEGSAWSGLLLAGFCNLPYLLAFRLMFPENKNHSWSELQWFSLPLGKQPDLLQVFVFCNLILWTFWLWQAVNRRFRNPSATLLSKRQSYYAMACFQVLLLGLTLTHDRGYNGLETLYGFSIVNLVAFVILTAALSPQRQTVQDWARYHHLQGNRRSAVREWIFGEKSPVLVAIALNLAITGIIWIPGILFLGAKNHEAAIVALLATANIIWICAAISQVTLLLKNRRRQAFAIASVAATIGLPPILLLVVSAGSASVSELWMFATFGWGLLDVNSIGFSISTILLGFLGQVCVMAALSWQLNRILHKVGDSDTKKLLQERRSLPS